MSLYSEIEASVFGGRPIELFRFVHGAEVWTYSKSSKEIVYNGETYSRLAISRSAIGQQGEINKADVTVTVPLDCGVSQLFLTGSPEGIVTLTIFRQHDGAEGTVVYWKGRVVLSKWPENTCEFTCESVYSTQKRVGLRARYTRNCRHVLYYRGCRLNKGDFAIPATVTAIDESLTVLTIPGSGYGANYGRLYGLANIGALSYPDGWFTAGMIGKDAAGYGMVYGQSYGLDSGKYRFVLSHVGDTLVLAGPMPSLAEGDVVSLYPGCDHGRTTCRDKFGNLANNGSFPWIPTDNPFVGSIV